MPSVGCSEHAEIFFSAPTVPERAFSASLPIRPSASMPPTSSPTTDTKVMVRCNRACAPA